MKSDGMKRDIMNFIVDGNHGKWPEFIEPESADRFEHGIRIEYKRNAGCNTAQYFFSEIERSNSFLYYQVK